MGAGRGQAYLRARWDRTKAPQGKRGRRAHPSRSSSCQPPPLELCGRQRVELGRGSATRRDRLDLEQPPLHASAQQSKAPRQRRCSSLDGLAALSWSWQADEAQLIGRELRGRGSVSGHALLRGLPRCRRPCLPDLHQVRVLCVGLQPCGQLRLVGCLSNRVLDEVPSRASVPLAWARGPGARATGPSTLASSGAAFVWNAIPEPAKRRGARCLLRF